MTPFSFNFDRSFASEQVSRSMLVGPPPLPPSAVCFPCCVCGAQTLRIEHSHGSQRVGPQLFVHARTLD